MTSLSFIFIGIFLINTISGNKNSDSGRIITIPPSSSSGSSSPALSLANFPDIVLLRQQKIPLDCTDENCVNEKLEKIMQQTNLYDDIPPPGLDYDWNKVKPSDSFDSSEVVQKRFHVNHDDYLHHSSCTCLTKFELLDLGHRHYPRYLVTAVCQNNAGPNRKCWRGSHCKEITYSVRVLTRRTENELMEEDPLRSLLPDNLRSMWKFITVTINAACQCSL